MSRSVEKIRKRLERATKTLEAAKVPYAVCGGNAVAAWVLRVDEAAVRNTRDVDILLRRIDLSAAIAAMEGAGSVYRHRAGIDMFLDDSEAGARDAVHVVFAGEKVRPDYPCEAPDVSESERTSMFRIVTLEALVRMKLTSYRDRDKTHLRDMLDVGLIDASWGERLPESLAKRLRRLVETPEG